MRSRSVALHAESANKLSSGNRRRMTGVGIGTHFRLGATDRTVLTCECLVDALCANALTPLSGLGEMAFCYGLLLINARENGGLSVGLLCPKQPRRGLTARNWIDYEKHPSLRHRGRSRIRCLHTRVGGGRHGCRVSTRRFWPACAASLSLFFLPTIIAGKRGVNAGFALFFVNLFVGWTVVGWIVCLIWAASGATRAQDAFYRNANGPFNRPVRPADSETIYQEAYAKERARLDHEATTKS
jgi:hypothetical protein